MRLPVLSLAVLTVACAGAVSKSSAATVYATGFESPSFTPGQLTPAAATLGQDKWSIDGNAASANIVGGSIGAGTTFEGTQALQVTATPPGSSYTYRTTPVNPATDGKIVSAKFAMKINDGSTRSTAWGGTVFDTGFTTVPAQILVTSQGALVTSDAQAGFPITANGVISRGSWHTYELRLNYVTNKYRVYVDDVAVTFTLSGQTYTDLGINVGDGTFGELDFQNTTTAGSNDSALFDAYSVTVSAVPEPTSLLALAGAACLGWRRKRA